MKHCDHNNLEPAIFDLVTFFNVLSISTITNFSWFDLHVNKYKIGDQYGIIGLFTVKMLFFVAFMHCMHKSACQVFPNVVKLLLLFYINGFQKG